MRFFKPLFQPEPGWEFWDSMGKMCLGMKELYRRMGKVNLRMGKLNLRMGKLFQRMWRSRT